MKITKRILALILSLLFVISAFYGCSKTDEASEEEIVNKDQYVAFIKTDDDADCSFIRLNEKNILIDTSEKDDSKSILKFLKSNNIGKIDYLIISHFDKDHCGGVDLINELEITNFIRPKYIDENKTSNKFIEAIRNKGITETVIDSVTELRFDTISLVFYPAETDYENKPSNNSSLMVKLTYYNKSILFTGDIESDRLADILAGDLQYLNCDVLKVPYHGREIENEELFINAVLPEYSIVTGSGGKVKKNIEKLSSSLGTVYYTQKGTVYIYFDYTNGLTAEQTK